MTARAIIFGCAGPRLSADERAFFRDADPWGFILFARNVETPDQMRALTGELRDCVGRPASVMMDQEGGRVQRLRPPHWRAYPPAARDRTEETVELRHRLIAAELAAIGVDMNCAPVLDTPWPGSHDVIGDRAFATEPEAVARLGAAARRGLSAGGVIPVIKHIPGHGRSMVDTHHDLPVVKASRADLERDFAPFRANSDAPVGMTCHLLFEAIDAEAPVTFSSRAIALIRDEIGFDGLLLTDDLSMGALRGGVGDRVRRSLKAGCDIALHCNGEPEEMREAAAAAPRLAGQSLARAAAVDALPRRALSFDPVAGERRYRELTGDTAHA